MSFIEAVELRKTYHVGKVEVQALRGVTISVERAKFVSVVGPSGSGKSTLFYLLGGLTRPDGGRIVIDGEDISQLSDAERTRMRKRKIGFVFQKFNLLPTLDARSNIEIARDIAGSDSRSVSLIVRRNSPEANSSGSRWHVHWSINPPSCWRTNLRATWIPRTLKSCFACYASQTRNSARPS